MIVIAQVHIVEMLKMGREFLDVRSPAVDAFSGVQRIEELDKVRLAARPE